MYDFEKIKTKAEELKKYFWDTNNDLKNKRFKEYVFQNENVWLRNANELRDRKPIETNFFFANLYCSRYSIKLLTDKVKFIETKKQFNVYEKIRILKDAFENSYQHFAFITICSNYNENFIQSLSEEWYRPEIAKEFRQSKTMKLWYNKEGEIISGKKWILLNCPLFKFSPIDINFLQTLKNADSHEKLVVTKTELILLDQEELRIKISDFNKFFRFIKESLSYCLIFHITLSVKYRFWIIPSLILVNPGLFNYERKSIPDITTIDSGYTKRKKNNKRKNPSFKIGETGVAYGYIFYDFVFFGMWDMITDEKSRINDFLSMYNLKLDYELLLKYRKRAIYEMTYIFIVTNDKLKRFYLDKTDDKPSFSVDEDNMEDFNPVPLIKDFYNTVQLIKDKKTDTKLGTLVLIGLAGLIGLFEPIYQLVESLKEIIKKNGS